MCHILMTLFHIIYNGILFDYKNIIKNNIKIK